MRFVSSILLLAHYSLLNFTEANVGFSLRGRVILNHGLVYFEDIGVDRSAADLSAGLACRTSATSNMCCKDYDGIQNCGRVEGTCATGEGSWIFPQIYPETNGNLYIRRQVDGLASGSNDGYGIHRNGGAVYLFRHRDITVHPGLWRCVIPDSSGTEQTLYIGIYSQQGTNGTIIERRELTFKVSADPLMFTLTLNTSGGPATYVRWTRDGVNITTLSNLVYSTTRQPTLVQSGDRGYREARYVIKLTVTGRHPGVYEVNVTNDRNGPENAIVQRIRVLDFSPTNLTITRMGLTSIRVSWRQPNITRYSTEYQYKLEFNFTKCTEPDTCTMATNVMLVNGDMVTPSRDYHNIQLWSVFHITITLVDNIRNEPGDAHLPIMPILYQETLTGVYAPSNVSTQPLNATSVMVTWIHPDQGLSVDEYIVSYQRINGTHGQCSTYQHDGNMSSTLDENIIIHGLQEFSHYIVSITAVNEAFNTMNESALHNLATSSAAPTGPAQNLTIMDITTTSINITWESVECIHRNGLITHYIINYGALNDSMDMNATVTGTEYLNSDNSGYEYTTTNIPVVPHACLRLPYVFRVAAVNSIGTGPYAEIQTVERVCAPSNVSTQPLNATSVMVTWIHPDQGLSVDEYIVSYQRINGTDGQCSTYQHEGNVSVDQNTQSHTFHGLKENSVYKISVTAKNTLFNAISEPISNEFETLSAAPTGTPQNLAYSSHNGTSVTITWNSVKCLDRNGLITHYIIIYEEIGGNVILSTNLTFNDTKDGGTYTINDLEPDKQYVVEVAAANKNGVGPIARLNISYTLPAEPDSTGSDVSTGFAVIAIVVSLALAVTALIIVAITMTMYRKRKQKKNTISLNNSSSDGNINLSTNETNNLELTSQGTCKNMYESTLEREKSCSVAHTELPMIKKFPEDIHVTEGQEVVLEVTVSGQPEPSLTWYHNGEELVANYSLEIDEDGRVYIPSSELRHSGVYKLVVKNTHGSDEREINLYIHNEDGTEFININQEEVDLSPVPVSEFGVFVAKHHEDFNAGFKAMYKGLYKGGDHTTKIGLSPANKKLNRFGNITVYDDNHIELKPDNGFDNTFVNACYIDGYGVAQRYIATQGPLPHTVSDFWRLVWQENVSTIVMVTNLKEGEKEKCQQYWPDSETQVYGPVEVTITDQQILADYVIRILFVKLIDKESASQLKVTQYHFTSWPDHGVPTYATSMLTYYRRVKAEHKMRAKGGPMLVHCSAGVGRTGTFIAIDWVLEQVEKEKIVDIAGTVNKMRQQRMKMVQTVEQFIFIHDAILESVTCGNTQINVADLRSVVGKMEKKDPATNKTMFQLHFDVLEQVASNSRQSMTYCATALKHPDKNRRMDYLPTENNRVILRGEFPDYIHATSVDGYREKNAYIIAEGPMKSTVRNFWKMICDRKCGAIIMLSDLVENGEESSFQYWPDNNEVRAFGDYTVEMTKELQFDGHTVRQLTTTMNMAQETSQCHQVTQFHITNWGVDGKCSDLSSISLVIDEVIRVKMRSENKPIVVHCSDTVGRSGMFCAISSAIEQCKSEGVVDVFQVVKAMRVQKPGAVLNVEQYQLVYDAVMTFLDSFDMYANFQQIV